MHLNLSREDLAFRDEVREFLAENLTPEIREAGRLSASSFSDFTISRRWYLALYKKGWAAPSWPMEHGGCAWTPDEVAAVPEVPYTLSGKKIEVPVKRILTGTPQEEAVSADTLRNPDALAPFLALGACRP